MAFRDNFRNDPSDEKRHTEEAVCDRLANHFKSPLFTKPSRKRKGRPLLFRIYSATMRIVCTTGTNAAYAATKAAAEALTLALASELSPSGATANIVRVRALLTRQMQEKDPSKLRPGFVPVDEVAEALIWLSGSAAAMMNGHRLHLTGPRTTDPSNLSG